MKITEQQLDWLNDDIKERFYEDDEHIVTSVFIYDTNKPNIWGFTIARMNLSKSKFTFVTDIAVEVYSNGKNNPLGVGNVILKKGMLYNTRSELIAGLNDDFEWDIE